jgi:hypothetical protein
LSFVRCIHAFFGKLMLLLLLCCRLDSSQPVIIRETKHCEGTMQQLAAAGAPTSVAGYEDAEAAAGVFSAIAPQCLAKFELHELLLPALQQQQQQQGDAEATAAAVPGSVSVCW